MNRRDFLKSGGLFSTAIAVQLGPLKLLASLPVETSLHNVLYRGTADGRILISRDAGQTWQLHIHLGAEYSVNALFVDWSQRIHAQVGFAGRSFELVLDPNGQTWRNS